MSHLPIFPKISAPPNGLNLSLTLVGGPTVRLDINGFVILTDPTFDLQPGDYALPNLTLTKLAGPAIRAEDLGPIDLVLLSHDQHPDNLDRAGRELLAKASKVLTTTAGAKRLGLRDAGMAPWSTVEHRVAAGITLRITATPARHGPAGIEPIAGDVIGFVISHAESGRDLFYATGDTCWYEGIAEVARRFRPEYILLFAGAAQTRGPFHMTMDTNEAIETAVHFPASTIIPVHHEGWKHYTQSAGDLERAFRAVELTDRLRIVQPGQPVSLTG